MTAAAPSDNSKASRPDTGPAKASPPDVIDREWLSVKGFNRLMRESEEFRAFATQVYDYLDHMKPGRAVSFARYRGRKLEWCIRTAAAFFQEGDHRRHFEFSDDLLILYHQNNYTSAPGPRTSGDPPPGRAGKHSPPTT